MLPPFPGRHRLGEALPSAQGELDLVLVPGFVSHVELLWEEPKVARFLRRHLPGARSGLEFAERGAHALKGAPGEWRLFAVL